MKFIFCLIFFYSHIYSQPSILLVKDDVLYDHDVIYKDMKAIGFNPDTIRSEHVNSNTFSNYQLVIIASGSNPNSCYYTNLRNALLDRTNINGSILIIGGQVGYNAAVSPQYVGFRNKVLHISSWKGNTGIVFLSDQAHSGSNLKNYPHILNDSFLLNDPGINDVDLVDNDDYSQMFFYSNDSVNYGGINVYPNADEPVIIYYSFAYSKITNRVFAKQLLENSISNLTDYFIGIEPNSNSVPDRISLSVYPNPFNSTVKIDFTVPDKMKNYYDINIYNAAGNLISVIESEKFFNSGTYSINFSAADYSSGIYFIRISDKINFSLSQKIVLIK